MELENPAQWVDTSRGRGLLVISQGQGWLCEEQQQVQQAQGESKWGASEEQEYNAHKNNEEEWMIAND